MREELKEIAVPIPEELPQRVGEALGQVRRLHRRRGLRRAGGALASLLIVAGSLFGVAAANPALASQLPLVGDWLGSLFFDANHDSKVGANGAFLETYEVLEEVNVAAAAENGEWTVTFLQGYTDGNTVQLSLELTGPQEELATYTGVDVGDYGRGAVTATINGEAAAVEGVNPFYEREGQWISTMTLAVPQSQQDAETLSLEVTLQDLEGRVENEEAQAAADQDQLARLEWEANEETAGTPYPEEPPVTVTSQPIPGSFSASFTLTVDREHSFSFAADAEDNGARVLAVSGTPTRTVITVEKPFWGLMDSIVETEVSTQGVACLELPDGTQLWMDFDHSRDLGGYDSTLQAPQQADLYFDGLPSGVTQVVLRFYNANRGEEVLAEFAINLTAQTVTP